MRVYLRSLFHLLTVVSLFAGCKNEPAQPTLFELKENTGIDFSNDIHNTKEFNIFSYRNFYNGAGVAIGDLNNDGLSDVFFTANMGSNKLYLNKGNWKFDDITDKAGLGGNDKWSTGVVMVDINHDGWLDIYVCNAGYVRGKLPENKLYLNNRNLTFTEATQQYGLSNKGGYCTHAAFFDYDLDGDLDCFIINNSFIPVNTLNYANKRELRSKDWPVPDALKGGGDRFLRNDNGVFTDISEQAGIHGSLISFGLGVTIGDVNNDGYPDVYVSNDFFERDYLYINQRNGTFDDQLEKWMQHTSLSSMGADMGDINNDGLPDIFVTDMLPDDDYRLKTTTSFENIDVYNMKVKTGFYQQYQQNTLQLNNGNGTFSEIAHYSGVAASDWSWGGLFFDADNDGYSDLFVCNGISHDVTDQDFIDFFANDVVQKMVLTGEKEEVDNIISKMPTKPLLNKAFRNRGNLQFADVGKNWGFNKPSFSNGAAYGDLDNDGDLDLVINNVNENAFVYRNNSREQNKNNYIGVRLKGDRQNTFAVGSVVKLYQGKEIITRELIPSRGFQSSVDYKIIVGVGSKAIDSMIVLWPDRSYTKIDKPAVNKVYDLRKETTSPRYVYDSINSSNRWLVPVTASFDKHVEDEYVDAYYDRNIPMMLTQEGPKLAHGDVNGDGLDDMYIGGAASQPGQLYLQTATGFVKKETPEFIRFASFEDVAALFFDADRDGDLDLYVGSAGNAVSANSLALPHRLYINDGKGNFTNKVDAFPANSMNVSVAAANDFDEDGDLDLFVGSRSIPQHYGFSPQSYLFRNDGTGKFEDIANPKFLALASVGLVTAATWADVDGDKRKELVVVGEWMAPTVFTFRDKTPAILQTSLDSLKGWWQSLAADDIDDDGDIDLILGNIGENFYLRPGDKTPVKIWMSDFDNNGSMEKIITRTVNDKDVPVFLKREITDQIASLKKQNLKYVDYGTKSIQDLFSPESMKKVTVKTFNYPSSCIAVNDGNGKFSVKPLPQQAQFSSLSSILLTDINGDGKKDIVAGGNKLCFLPQFGRLDASYGHLLFNDGKGNFNYCPANQSGISIRGAVTDIAEIKGRPSNKVIFLQNNDFPALFKTGNRK